MNSKSRTIGVFLVGFITLNSAIAQTFIRSYGAAQDDVGYAVVATLDNGILVVGRSNSFGETSNDVYVIKLDSVGNVSWSKTLGGANFDYGHNVQQLADASFVIVGRTESFGVGGDMYVLRISPVGNLLWSKTYGGSSQEEAYSVLPLNDGGFAIAGITMSYGAGGWDACLLKIDSLGDVQWFRTYGSYTSDQVHHFAQTKDGGYILTGITYGFGVGAHDAFLLKTDSSGSMQWMKTYGTSVDDGGHFVTQTSDGGYFVSGHTHVNGTLDALFMKVDSLGSSQWSKVLNTEGDDRLWSGRTAGDSAVVLTGPAWNPVEDNTDIWVVSIDYSGNIVFSHRFDGLGIDFGRGVSMTREGGFIAVGPTTAGTENGSDVFVIRTNMYGWTDCGTEIADSSGDSISLGITTPAPVNGLHLLTSQSAATVSEAAETEMWDFCMIEKALLFVPNVYGQSGDTISVPVNLANPQGVAGGDVVVSFDSSVLVPLEVRKGTLTQEFSLAVNLANPDSVRVSFANSSGMAGTLEGSVFVVVCSVNPEIPETTVSPIQLLSAQLYDEHAGILALTTSSGEFQYATYRKGDINLDDDVNGADAILCLRISAGLELAPALQLWAADFDGDGSVSEYDAVGILREAVGLPTVPPSGTYQTRVIVTIPAITASQGSNARIPVRVSGLPDLVSGSMQLRIGTQDISITGTSVAETFTQGLLIYGTKSPDEIRIGFASPYAWQQNDEVLLNLDLVAQRNLNSFLPQIGDIIMYDRFGRKIESVTVIVTSADDEPVPHRMYLSQNYPNPFNPMTEIHFEVDRESFVSLRVYDVLGRLVRTLAEGRTEAGSHRIMFDAESLPSGVYFYTLSTPGKVETKSMMLLR